MKNQKKSFDLVALTLKIDLLFENFNIGHIFLTGRGRAFIFNISVTREKAFHHVHQFFDLWTLNFKFDIFSKT